MLKAQLRERYRKLRASFVKAEDGADPSAGQRLNERLYDFLKSQKGTWATYVAAGSEADPAFAVEKSSHITWSYPVSLREELRFYVPSHSTAFVKNRWNILEPDVDSSLEVSSQEMQGFLVPGVAFDRQGGRLGSGKGFYDRAVGGLGALKVGVAFDVQVGPQALPMESHDVKMDFIITEKEIFKVSTGAGVRV